MISCGKCGGSFQTARKKVDLIERDEDGLDLCALIRVLRKIRDRLGSIGTDFWPFLELFG